MSSTVIGTFGGAFSMGKSKRSSFISNQNTPGPGNYNISPTETNKKKKGFTISEKSKRSDLIMKQISPPVGNYDFNNSSIGIGSKITISKRLKQPESDKNSPTIGPGYYDPQVIPKQNPKFTFQSKWESFVFTNPQKEKIPGVGTYNIQEESIDGGLNNSSEFQASQTQTQKFKHTKSIGFTKASKDFPLSKEIVNVPGPGQYPVEKYKSFEKQDKVISFSKSQRFKKPILDEVQESPDMGTYNVEGSLLNKSKPFTFGEKLNFMSQQNQTPGPGTYQSIYSQGRVQKIGFGTTQRNFISVNEAPGPGHYQNPDFSYRDNTVKQNIGFGASIRKGLFNNETSPGPGTYQIPEDIGKSRSTLIKQSKIETQWVRNPANPGVGQYELNDLYTKKNSTQINFANLSKRENNLVNSSKELPGPGHYDGSFNKSFVKESPSYKFGASKRYKQDIKDLFSPCPGSYDIPNTIAGMPSYLQNSLFDQK